MEPRKFSPSVSRQDSADRNCIFTHVIEDYLQDHLAEKIQCKWPRSGICALFVNSSLATEPKPGDVGRPG